MKVNKLLLADPQRLFTEGLRLLIKDLESVSVVSTCSTTSDLLFELEKFAPDMCIVDPAGFVEGDELIKKIYQVRPSVKVFILTCRKDADFVFSLYNIGIAGYVLKTSEAKVLYKALSVVLEDGQFIEPILIPALKDKIDRLESGSLSDDFALTKRERAILQYVAGGLYNKEIAFNLGIKEKTVKNHITSLFKKIGVKDRIQAAVFAVKNGYVNI